MKVKVATTFNLRTCSQDGQSTERFVSSALSVDPEGGIEGSDKDYFCEPLNQPLANACPERSLCANYDIADSKPFSPTSQIPKFLVIGRSSSEEYNLPQELCEQFGCVDINVEKMMEEYSSTHQNQSGPLKPSETVILGLLQQKLLSDDSVARGYVISGISPTNCDASSIKEQFGGIFALENGPEYIIDIKNPHEFIRIDSDGGKLMLDKGDPLMTGSRSDQSAVVNRNSPLSDLEQSRPEIQGETPRFTISDIHQQDRNLVPEEQFQSLVNTKFIFGRDVPRVILVGKPWAGKSTLGQLLAEAWDSRYINVADLVAQEARKKTQRGTELRNHLEKGMEAPDAIIFSLVNEELDEESTAERGYILDGMPTNCTLQESVHAQLNFLSNIHPPAAYWIVIELDDAVLRAQCIKLRRETAANLMEEHTEIKDKSVPSNPSNSYVSPSTAGAAMDDLEKRIYYYNLYVTEPLERVLRSLPSQSVIRLRRSFELSELVHDTVRKLRESYGVPRLSILRTISSANDMGVPFELLGSRSIWQQHVPRLVLVGKPCAGKTTLANIMCQAWGCEHVNAIDLIERHIKEESEYGKTLNEYYANHEQPPSGLILDIINLELQKENCRNNGYILENFPNFAQKLTDVENQLQWLLSLEPSPLFWVVVEISDEDLSARWNAVRISHGTGAPCSEVEHVEGTPNSTCDFPFLDDETKRLLLGCPDLELNEVKAHVKYYNQNVVEPLERFLQHFDPTSVVYLNAVRPPKQLAKELNEIIQYRIDRWPDGVPPANPEPFEEFAIRFPKRLSSHDLASNKGQTNILSTPGLTPAMGKFGMGNVLDPSPVTYTDASGPIMGMDHERSSNEVPRPILASGLSPLMESMGMGHVPESLYPSNTQTSIPPLPQGFSPVTGQTPMRPTGQTPLMGVIGMGHMPDPTSPTDSTKQSCCCQCGARALEKASLDWGEKIPRFMIIGKPCTGKTGLAKTMCEAWGCELINATELILEHMSRRTPFGKTIQNLLSEGKDLTDELVLTIVSERLHASSSRWHGFVLDDFPTYSEKHLSVQRQLDFLSALDTPPDYVIHIQVPDEQLRARWENVKIDLHTGLLFVMQACGSPYPKQSGSRPSCCMPSSPDRLVSPPAEGQLITRHEDLDESVDANINFYHEVVEPQLLEWVHNNFADRIITMDGELCISDMFQVLQRKMEIILKNPDRPLDQLFTDKDNSFLPGSSCNRCGMRYENLEPILNLWEETPPRFIIFGKPCTGKTLLAKRICSLWNCQLVNASDLISEHLARNTSTGQKIRDILNSGQDLSDQFVIDMINEKLATPGCAELGFVLDGIPTHSEKSQSISQQMDFLERISPRPDYIIDVRISDSDLRIRWETVRIDVEDGELYVSEMYGQKAEHPGGPQGRIVRHPDFPRLNEKTKERLITRHEELPENLDKHFAFYNTYIAPQIEKFIQSHDPSKVVVLNGDMTPTKMLNTLLYKLHVMALNPGAPSKGLFPEDGCAVREQSGEHCCAKRGIPWSLHLEELWLEKPPRVMILGKPCTGKTTLARRLCAMWGCELVNASTMLMQQIENETPLGCELRKMLESGADIPDHQMLSVIQSVVTTGKCIEDGYILDGLPTHSELSMSIEDQLQMLRSMPNGPEYIIDIQMDDEELYNRWKDIRIDLSDGVLYSKLNYDRRKPSQNRRQIRHPDFPYVDESVKERLLTRHEELPENLAKHFDFYRDRLDGPLKNFISSHDPAAIVRVKGNVTPTELLQAVLQQFSIMARHPGVPTSILFRGSSEDTIATVGPDCQCECAHAGGESVNASILWRKTPPRILIVGNSCTGKSTLARRMAKEWNCNLVNGTELILHRMKTKTTMGDHLRRSMAAGHDLPDDIVLELLRSKLESEDCIARGYILDDFPTSSEKAMSIREQLDMILSLPCAPEYVIDIQLSEDDLKRRWESIRIDLADGALYPEKSFADPGSLASAHPAFPTPNESIRQRLITRHEEIVENIEKQTEFYRNRVRPQVEEFLNECYKDHVIHVDGTKKIPQQFRIITKAIQEIQREVD